jgi:hypothetical protein
MATGNCIAVNAKPIRATTRVRVKVNTGRSNFMALGIGEQSRSWLSFRPYKHSGHRARGGMVANLAVTGGGSEKSGGGRPG